MKRINIARALPSALAAVAVLLVACGNDQTPAGRADAQKPTTPTTQATDSRDFVLLLDDDTDPDQVEGKPGWYAMTARGMAKPPLAVVDVPAGFTNFGFFALWPEDSAHSSDPFRGIQYWTVYAVHENPCRSMKGPTQIGDSVGELADALAAQKLTSATKPEPVSLDGHDGVYLELTMPTGIDFETCDQGYFFLWDAKPGDAHHTADSPGLVERLWILDVDGDRVVLAAPAAVDNSAAEIDELTAIAESVRFVRAN